jgi:predicted RNA binding protein YcfA (HicA-like mRNA interferase family)
MPELPQISGAKAVKAFGKLGFYEVRQRGSHVVLKKEDHPLLLSVPMHDELRKGTLRALIRDSGFTVEQFCDQL